MEYILLGVLIISLIINVIVLILVLVKNAEANRTIEQIVKLETNVVLEIGKLLC